MIKVFVVMNVNSPTSHISNPTSRISHVLLVLLLVLTRTLGDFFKVSRLSFTGTTGESCSFPATS